MKNKEIIYQELTSSIGNVVNENVTLKNDLSLTELLELKKALSPINNLITAKLTEKFITNLRNYLPSVSNDKIQDLLRKNALINVNANGYDFKDDDIRVIGEVKANVPYCKTKYGASQKSGLEKDVAGMLSGKAKERGVVLSNYYKVLITLNYQSDGYSSIAAVESFIDTSVFGDKLFLLKEGDAIQRKDIVYVLMLNI